MFSNQGRAEDQGAGPVQRNGHRTFHCPQPEERAKPAHAVNGHQGSSLFTDETNNLIYQGQGSYHSEAVPQTDQFRMFSRMAVAEETVKNASQLTAATRLFAADYKVDIVDGLFSDVIGAASHNVYQIGC